MKSKPVIFDFNQKKIWRVISNLLGKAIKFSPNKSKIEVTVKTLAAAVVVSIKDQGIGIPDDLKSNHSQ